MECLDPTIGIIHGAAKSLDFVGHVRKHLGSPDSHDESRTSVFLEILEFTAGLSKRELEWFGQLLDILRNRSE